MTDDYERRFAEVNERLTKQETDLKWVKWLSASAAASGAFNVFLNAGPAPAIVGGVFTALALAASDLLRAH